MLQQTKRCWTIPCSRFRNSRSWILNLSVCVCEDVPDWQSTQGWLNKFVNVTHPMNPHSNTLDNFKRTCWSDAPRFPCFFVLMNYLPQSLLMSETYPDGAITHILNQQSLVLCRLGHSVMCCHVICEIKKKKIQKLRLSHHMLDSHG